MDRLGISIGVKPFHWRRPHKVRVDYGGQLSTRTFYLGPLVIEVSF